MTTQKINFDNETFREISKNKFVRVALITGCTILAFYLFGKLMKLSAGVVNEFNELREAIKK